MMRSLLLGMVFFAGIPQLSTAQTNTDRPIPVSVPFLRLNHDIRAAGMGDAATALPGSTANHFANPARMMEVQGKGGAQLSYIPWLQNMGNKIAHYSTSGYLHADEKQTFSGGFRYFKQGTLKVTDVNGNTLMESKPGDLAVDLSYARRLSDHWNIGTTFRYINSRIISADISYGGYSNANTVAADLGVYYQGSTNSKGETWYFGTAITNIGGKIAYNESATNQNYLPANFSAGGSFKKENGDHQFILTAEMNKLLVPSIQEDGTQPEKSAVSAIFSSWTDATGGFSEEVKEMQWNAGAEYTYQNLLSVRAGYNYQNTSKGGANYFTTGLGVQLKPVQLNMAYTITNGGTASNALPNTWKLGLAFFFSK
ncbi:MAG TPA: type IX secretion system outer membrane channel protein PorV [Phnomibacter sp.]|nr:type IX secretion system outer membrane channel protein PorV [Phnomibacter sp.]